MKRQWGAALAAICVLGIGLAVLPEAVEAQKVANPGTFTLNSTGGAIKIGSTVNVDLAPRVNAQCGDGVDNDGDGRIDALDSGCVAGSGQPQSADDSELAPGYQPKVDVTISGSINANGVISIPAANIVFPIGYIPIRNPFDGYTDIVTTTIIPTADATGTLDPLTGDAVINLAFRVRIGGTVSGNAISSNCTIGTAASPIRLNLITGTKPAIGQNNALTGSRYNATTGTAVLVENAFAVPAATSCPIAGGFDVTPNINQQMALPSPAGRNLAYVSGRTTPALGKAVNPVILPAVSELRNNPVPYTVTFSAADSTIVKGPSPYVWEFSDGTTATGITVTKTFTTAGNHFARLTMTDTDGDTASVTSAFALLPGSTSSTTSSTTTSSTSTTSTSTTTSSTSSTTSSTSSTTTSTTTTAPTTTSTTTTSTTTTAPTTTSTTTTAPTTTSTTTTAPTTTSTTTTAPTTTSTTTTAPTTTSTTIPQPSNDAINVVVSGSHAYTNGGSGNGNLTVRRDAFGIASVSGFLDIPGTSGGTARVSVNAQRAWILPLWSGQITIVDQSAGLNLTTPIFGSINRAGSDAAVSSTASWFRVGAFPNLIRPYTVNWTVTDAG